MNPIITSGSLELIASGTARTAFDNRLKFDFGEIWFEFVFSESTEEDKAIYEVTDDNLGLTCYIKMKSSLYGVATPAELGDLNDRIFYVSYEVKRPSSKHKLWVLSYSFFLGEPVNE